MVSDTRKGLSKTSVKSSVLVDTKLINDQRGIYVCRFVVQRGEETHITHTVYSMVEHDMSINGALRKINLRNRKVDNIEIIAVKKVGDSIADKAQINDWKYEEKGKD